jgi:uncharacterized membrane protein YeaQ/YmgE (transglycosylase-associated protein family)
MGILLWIVFGALVGWIASKIMGTDESQGGLANIVVGIIGAVIGGFIAELIGLEGVTGFNLGSFAIALVGAMLLIGLLKVLSGRRTGING